VVLLFAVAVMLAIGLPAQAEEDRQGVTDPLLFSTFMGGGNTDWPHATVVASNGTIYITGFTLSFDFPTTEGAYQRVTKGNEDVYVLHLSADGSELLWATLIGGTGQDIAWDLAVGTDGRVYVTGQTWSADFPTTQGAYLRTREGDSDAFVLCLAPDGGSLVYSTLLGGGDDDEGFAIEVLNDGRAVVAGSTGSMFFPTTSGAYDRSLGGVEDVFVSRLSSDGRSLEASTYLGGSYTEMEPAMALDGSGNIWVTGSTTSEDFPTTSGLSNDWSIARDVFVTALSPDLARNIRSTVVGMEGSDVPRSIDIGPQGEVMVAGYTHSPEFPVATPDPGDDNSGEWDGFILVYKSTLLSRDHQRLYGGSDRDVIRAARFDGRGLIHVVGYTNSTNFPTTLGSYQPYRTGDNHDIFYMQLDQENWYRTINSTYIGKAMGDFGMGLDLDRWDTPIIVGHTRSLDFPVTPNAYDDTNAGGGDIVVLKYTTDEEPPEFSNDGTPRQVGTGSDITFSIDVTDWTGVHAVAVDLVEGTGDNDRHYMEYMAGNGTYTVTIPISIDTVSLEYKFMAWDVLGRLNVTEHRWVTIIDTIPPALIADGTPSSGTTGDPLEFLLHVRDNWQVEGASVEYVIGDRNANSSMDEDMRFGSNKERWNLTVHIADGSLDPIRYRFHFWDHAGNAVTTQWTTVPVLDDDAPVLGEMTVPPFAQPGTTVTVSVDVSDNIGVQEVRLDHYITPTAVETITVAGPFGPTIEVEVPIPLDKGELHVEFHVEDAAGNTASVSGVIPFRDEDPPQMYMTHDDIATTGDWFNVSWSAEDPAGILEMWGFYVFGEGRAFEEYTFFNPDGLPTAHYSIAIPGNSIEPLFIILASRDTFRNQNQTEPIRIEVVDDTPPIAEVYLENRDPRQDWMTAVLDARDSRDNIGIVRYEWSWSLLDNADLHETSHEGSRVSLTFDEPGVYTIYLTVYDADGNNDTMEILFEAFRSTPDEEGWPPWLTYAVVGIVVGMSVVVTLLFLRNKARPDGSGET